MVRVWGGVGWGERWGWRVLNSDVTPFTQSKGD